ncbi:MAG TPA: hypothetical protein VH092_03105 [Urbifossiella sp.]|jgi:hypothetical protein|nr:hypothetical protein [Urbifossiella sp.]
MPADTSLIPIPAHVKLGYWAVAAGTLGHPVHVVFRDYPPWVVAQLYSRYAACSGPKGAVYVHAERDLRALELRCSDNDTTCRPGLVLLTAPKLATRTAWLLSGVSRAVDDSPAATPVLLTTLAAGGHHDCPGPSITLHGASPELSRTMHWLDGGPPLPPLATTGRRVAFDALAPLFRTGDGGADRPTLRLPDKLVLRGLLAGAALWRRPDAAAGGTLAVGVEDYRAVFDPLRDAATQSGDAPFDPLALAMVRRANLFLSLRAGGGTRPGSHDGATAPERGITRRELIDLGNTRGVTLRVLVQHLRDRGAEGLAHFKTLGTARPLGRGPDWPADTVAGMAALLLEWSVKQVRTHFERLHAGGLVTGRRAAPNQPWVYQLPEGLETPRSAVGFLPTPDELERLLAAPACPAPGADRTPWPGGDSGRNTPGGPAGPSPGASG